MNKVSDWERLAARLSTLDEAYMMYSVSLNQYAGLPRRTVGVNICLGMLSPRSSDLGIMVHVPLHWSMIA